MKYTFFQNIIITNHDTEFIRDLNKALTIEDVARAYWNFHKRDMTSKGLKVYQDQDIPIQGCVDCKCKGK